MFANAFSVCFFPLFLVLRLEIMSRASGLMEKKVRESENEKSEQRKSASNTMNSEIA